MMPDLDTVRTEAASRPNNAQAHYSLGTALWSAAKREEAITHLRCAVTLDPAHTAARSNFGKALAATGRLAEAEAQYRAAIALSPERAELHYNLGNALLMADRPADAEPCFRITLTLQPDHAGAHNNLGSTLRSAGRHEEAIACYRRALALRPDYFGTLNNIGSALLALHRPAEAEPHFRHALQHRPDYAEACNNLGGALLALDRLDEAAIWFRRAWELDSGQVQARFGEALALLSLGRFREGWEAYESRWLDPRFLEDGPVFPDAPWRGDTDLSGRRFFVHAEQGLGDTIHFARYLPLLRRLGARVVLQAQAPLIPLLRPLADAVMTQDDPVPSYDLRCPLLSLPRAFGTELATIPAEIPYLHAAPGRVAAWRERLGPRRRPRVGVAWSGSPDHPSDAIRSLRAAALLPALAGVELHAVQTEIRPADEAAAAAIRQHAPELPDFAETAALLCCLDLVISVDTSVAHLAGALGRPVWLLLHAGADFRWLHGRDDSPWYPTARLFRQARAGDWAEVIGRVARALQARAAASGPDGPATL